VEARDLVELLSAAHLTAYVQDSRFSDRGGIMLVAPPGGIKSTFVMELEKHYSDVMCLTDLTMKSLAVFRERIVSGRYHTLVFPEFQKLYERRLETAANIEGALRALAGEGFKSAPWEPQGVSRIPARALVIGALTIEVRDRYIERWDSSGFARRFLWPLYRLENPEVLDEAVVLWRRLNFQSSGIPAPAHGEAIPNKTTQAERKELQHMLRYQPGDSSVLQHALLCKMLACLRWFYDRVGVKRKAIDTMRVFGESLGREGTVLRLPPHSRETIIEVEEEEAAMRRAQQRAKKPNGTPKKRAAK